MMASSIFLLDQLGRRGDLFVWESSISMNKLQANDGKEANDQNVSFVRENMAFTCLWLESSGRISHHILYPVIVD